MRNGFAELPHRLEPGKAGHANVAEDQCDAGGRQQSCGPLRRERMPGILTERVHLPRHRLVVGRGGLLDHEVVIYESYARRTPGDVEHQLPMLR